MLALGKALIAEPALLLLDEPTIGLRRPVVDELAAAVRALRDRGPAIVVVEQAPARVRPSRTGHRLHRGEVRWTAGRLTRRGITPATAPRVFNRPT